MNVNSGRAALIAAASLIVWEEFPSANVAAILCSHEICSSIMKNRRPFGNIPFIGVGDFRQVSPVVKGQGIAPAVHASIQSSNLWSKFKTLTLDVPIRSENDIEYTEFVDDIGEDWQHDTVSLSILETVCDINDALEFLFPPDVLSDPFRCVQRAFLSPKNEFVDDFNNTILNHVPGNECQSIFTPFFLSFFLNNRSQDCYYSADSIKEEDAEIDYDFLGLLSHNGIPPHILRLKEGSICSIMRNLSMHKGLVKNARVIVNKLHTRFVEVRIIDNRSGELGRTHLIPRIRFEFSAPHSSWTVVRIQVPLRLAYACTFNGCVGLTFAKTVLDLRNPVFAHGQLYTALSCVRRRTDSCIFLPDQADKNTVNVVYKELLLSK